MRYEDHLDRRTTTEARADAAAAVVRHAHASVAAVARRQHVRPREYLDALIDDLSPEPDTQTQP